MNEQLRRREVLVVVQHIVARVEYGKRQARPSFFPPCVQVGQYGGNSEPIGLEKCSMSVYRWLYDNLRSKLCFIGSSGTTQLTVHTPVSPRYTVSGTRENLTKKRKKHSRDVFEYLINSFG